MSFFARWAWLLLTSHHGLVVAMPVAAAAFRTCRRETRASAIVLFSLSGLLLCAAPASPSPPPSVRPFTTHRWKTRYRITGGRELRTAEPIIGPQKNTSSTMKLEMPAVTVRTSLLLTKTCAYRNSPQAWVNEKNATTASAGSDIGRMMRTRVPIREQPSTSAASSSSSGTERKYPIKSQVQNGTVKPRYARTSPWYVSMSRNADITANSGMKRSDGGTRYVKTRPRAMVLRPRKRSRASAYAPRQPNTSEAAVVATAMMVEFLTYFTKGVFTNRSR